MPNQDEPERSTFPAPPVADRRPSVTLHHGVELVDEYAWLRAGNWDAVIDDPDALAPDIRAYLEQENQYAEAVTAPLGALRGQLTQALQEAADADDGSTVPENHGPWTYFVVLAPGADHPRYCRRHGTGGREQLILDAERLARSRPHFAIEDARHSPDHRLFAYAYDTTGSERFTIRIRDIEAGRNLPDEIRGASGYLAWSADSRHLYYVKLDRQHRPLLVYRHEIGTPASRDVLVYREHDPAFDVAVEATMSGDYVLIDIDAHHAGETWLIDARNTAGAPRLVAPRQDGHHYDVDQLGERLFLLTTSEAAADYRICEAPITAGGVEDWREIVPHVPGRRILDMVVMARHLVRLERHDGVPRIVVRRLADGTEHDIAFDEPACVVALHGGFEQDADVLRYSYESMVTPEQVWEYDLATSRRTLFRQDRIGNGYDPGRYVMRRFDVPSHDGVSVPVTVLHAKSTVLDATAPLVLEAYGGYGDALEPDFDYDRFLLVDRGFVYALAHVRGGEEKGAAWHATGRHENKPNSIEDFIAVGRYLAAAGYTARGRIVARGESAGGMLVAAAANIDPDLFLAISAGVPFVDVLNTMLDAGLPLTPGEWPEWGNPISSAADFALIGSYCPYQNVRRMRYPHVLARASLGDQRVGYWEPAKWIARLRANTTGDSQILLTVAMEGGGHDGAAGRSGCMDEIAREYAWIISLMGGEPSA